MEFESSSRDKYSCSSLHVTASGKAGNTHVGKEHALYGYEENVRGLNMETGRDVTD